MCQMQLRRLFYSTGPGPLPGMQIKKYRYKKRPAGGVLRLRWRLSGITMGLSTYTCRIASSYRDTPSRIFVRRKYHKLTNKQMRSRMPRGDRLIRQWSIMRFLAEARYGKTVAEIAEALECRPRTVYRDLEVLQGAGFPLYTERLEGRNVWIMLDTKIVLPVITEAHMV
ncbi:HTH domain-containing protein [Thermodesulfobacteriota bacterium]